MLLFFALSIGGTHYLLKHTEFISEIRKVPFIGFKLSIIVLGLIVVSGLPIIYILYKFILVLKNSYSKTSETPFL
jgi:hypothetical protein